MAHHPNTLCAHAFRQGTITPIWQRTSRRFSRAQVAQVRPTKPEPLRFVQLHDGTFRFGDAEGSIEAVLAEAGTFTEEDLALYPPKARADREVILAVFRAAVALPESDRAAFLRAQDEAQTASRRPAFSLSPPWGVTTVDWTLDQLVVALDEIEAKPGRDLSHPLRDFEPMLARVGRLIGPLDQGPFRVMLRRLTDKTRTGPEAVELAHWYVRVGQDQPEKSVAYEATHALLNTLDQLSPIPPLGPYIEFAARRYQVKVFSLKKHPLVQLLERITKTFTRHRRPWRELAVPAEEEQRRASYLEAIQAIRRAMDTVGPGIYSVRSSAGLMDAYSRAGSFVDAHAIWLAARSEHGSGIDSQGVAMFLDACGFECVSPTLILAAIASLI